MPSHHVTDGRILGVMTQSPGMLLDDVALECPELTWNQIFMAVDRLSREGSLTLTIEGHGIYRVRLSEYDGQGAHQLVRV